MEGKTARFPFCLVANSGGCKGKGRGITLLQGLPKIGETPCAYGGAKPLNQSIVGEGVKAGAGRNDQMILQGYIQRLTCRFKASGEVNIRLTWP